MLAKVKQLDWTRLMYPVFISIFIMFCGACAAQSSADPLGEQRRLNTPPRTTEIAAPRPVNAQVVADNKTAAVAPKVAGEAAPKKEAPARGEAPAKKEEEKPPIDITAEIVDYDVKGQKAVFIGNVHVVDVDLDMRAQRMNVVFNDDNSIRDLVALGKVVILNKDSKTTGGKAVYDTDKDVITVTQKPIIIEPDREIHNAEYVKYDKNKGTFKAYAGKNGQLKILLKNKQKSNDDDKGEASDDLGGTK